MWRIETLSAGSPHAGEWQRMRAELWPHLEPEENRSECRSILQQPARLPVFVALDAEGRPVGFAEARLRDFAEGCVTSPVGYLEGWYVRETWRRAGVGRALLLAAEEWARSQGATEMASDTDIGNRGSELAHKALGFEEVERAICFRKPLTRPPHPGPPAARE
ncbi:MAG: GNAT family N-acetyltransferase [Bryobacterales bacterium]|nr:GNAT family N-acetyltransferase [Bryobacterales bacterium]